MSESRTEKEIGRVHSSGTLPPNTQNDRTKLAQQRLLFKPLATLTRHQNATVMHPSLVEEKRSELPFHVPSAIRHTIEKQFLHTITREFFVLLHKHFPHSKLIAAAALQEKKEVQTVRHWFPPKMRIVHDQQSTPEVSHDQPLPSVRTQTPAYSAAEIREALSLIEAQRQIRFLLIPFAKQYIRSLVLLGMQRSLEKEG